MAKIQTVEVENDKDLTGLIEVIGPRDLDTKTRNTLVSIVVGFLDSLKRRELEAQQKTEALLAMPALTELLDHKTGTVVIATHENANLAGKLANDLAEGAKEIGESWEKETTFFHRFHKTLTERRGNCQKALNAMIAKLKDGVRLWKLKEEDHRAKEALKANIKMAQQFQKAGIAEPAPAIIPEAIKVEGMSGREVWRYEVPDLDAFVKLVAKGKAPREALQINDKWLSAHVAQYHDRAIEDPKTGKKYLYEGTIEIIADIQMVRR